MTRRLHLATIGQGNQFDTTMATAGLTADDLVRVGLDPDLAAQWVGVLHQLQDDLTPWGVPFRLYAGPAWRPLDGIAGCDMEVRVIPGGVEVRTRRDCERSHAHNDDCLWSSVEQFEGTDQWRRVTRELRIQVATSVEEGDRLLTVSKRQPLHAPEPEHIWSEPWSKEDKMGDDWMYLGGAVRYRGSPHNSGILVQRATRLFPELEWSTSKYFRATRTWRTIAPGLQARFWVGADYPRKIEFRQATSYQLLLECEPIWGEMKDAFWVERKNLSEGYSFRFIRGDGYRSSSRDIYGLRVTAPGGSTWDIPEVIQDWVSITPTMRLMMSSQGTYWIQTGTFEPVEEPANWSPPTTLAMADTMTYLGDKLRVRYDYQDSYRYVVEQFTDDHGWVVLGYFQSGTTQDLTPAVRVSFADRNLGLGWGTENEVTVQMAESPKYDEDGWSVQPLEFELGENWQQVLPGLQMRLDVSRIAWRTWLPQRGYPGTAVGSIRRGGWSGQSDSPPKTLSENLQGAYGGVRVRLSRRHCNVVEIWTKRPEDK